MYRILKLITIIGASIIVFLIGNFVFKSIKYGHSTDWEKHKEYMWIFNDSIHKDIDTIGFSYVGRNNILSNFHYKSDLSNYDFGINIRLWEFKNEKKINLKEIIIDNKSNIYDVSFEEGETLDKGSEYEIEVKFDFSFKEGLNIHVNKFDTILSYYSGENYIGCYGKFKNISISNKKKEHQILFRNEFKSPLTSVVVYKKNKSIFLIVIHSEKHFDKDIIKILNLK